MLQSVQSGAHEHHFSGLEYVAEAAVNIIRDAHNDFIAKYDVETLTELIREIDKTLSDDNGLCDYLTSNSHDCDICRAVASNFASG
jgi:hypothetical protein